MSDYENMHTALLDLENQSVPFQSVLRASLDTRIKGLDDQMLVTASYSTLTS
ncbi:MAG: hypothetical protein WAM14_04115 [Candidatus Nitrosopolaris sp.]